MRGSLVWILAGVGSQALSATAAFVEKALLLRHDQDARDIARAGGIFELLLGLVIVAARGGVALPGPSTFLALGAGVLLYLYVVPYYRALRLDDTSVVVPVYQIVAPLTLLLSLFLLGEGLEPIQYAGFATIVLGAALFVRGDGSVARVLRFRTAGLVALSCVPIALSATVLDFVLAENDYFEVLPLVLVGGGLGATGATLLHWRSQPLRSVGLLGPRGWGLLAGAEALSIGSDALFTFAIAAGPVALVAVTVGTEPPLLLAIGLALTAWWPWILTERVSRRGTALKLGGSLLVLAGLPMIAF